RAQSIRPIAEMLPPLEALFDPISMPFLVGSRLHKILHFHLFEFAGSKDKFFSYYLVSKRFTLLRYSERNFHRHAVLHIQKLHEHTLSCFGPKVNGAFL